MLIEETSVYIRELEKKDREIQKLKEQIQNLKKRREYDWVYIEHLMKELNNLLE